MTAPCVVGLDLSMTATGVAFPGGDVATWRPKASDGDRRLLVIHHHLLDLLLLGEPDLVVIEDLPVHAHAAGVTGMVQGVVRRLLLDQSVPYLLVPPATLKTYATGKGNSDKPDMRMALYQRTALDLRDNNQVDAAWLRLLGLDHLGHPELTLPATHRRALDKLPEVTK